MAEMKITNAKIESTFLVVLGGVGNIIEDKWLYDRLDIISINRESK